MLSLTASSHHIKILRFLLFAFLILLIAIFVRFLNQDACAVMDPISLTASIVAILQATGTIVQFINDIQDSRQDRINLRNELSSVSFALQMLRERIDQEQKGLDGGDPSWLSSVLMLGIPMGPLEQFEDVLAQLEKFLPVADEKGNKLKRLGKALNWPFQKADVDKYLRILERQKSMFYLALQNDNL